MTKDAGQAGAQTAFSGAVPVNSGRWTIVGLLFVASLINYLDRSTISLALPLVSKDLVLGPESKGLLLSAFFWSYALMQIPIGWTADRVNLRWFYAAAFALWSLGQGLTGFAGSLGVLILFRILLGVGESIYYAGRNENYGNLLFRPAERGLPCGLFDFGTRMGLVLGSLLIPWLLVHWGRTALQLPADRVCGAVVAGPWLLSTKRLIGPLAADRLWRRATAQHLRLLLSNRDLIGICLGFFCFDYYWYLLVTWLPDYLVTVRHFTILHAGVYALICPTSYSEPANPRAAGSRTGLSGAVGTRRERAKGLWPWRSSPACC